MATRLLIIGKNSQIQSDAFQALGSACGFGAPFLPRPAVPCADFYSGNIAGIDARPGRAIARGSARKQPNENPTIHPERPGPASSALDRADLWEVLLWVAALLLVVGLAKGVR